MIGPKCEEQLEAGCRPGGNPEDLKHAIAVAETLISSGGVRVDTSLLERARGRLPTIKCEYQLRVSIEKGDIAALRGGISQAVDVEGLDKGLFAEACQALVEKCQEQLRLRIEGTDVEALQKKHQASRGGSGFATKDMGWRREQLGNKLRCATD